MEPTTLFKTESGSTYRVIGDLTCGRWERLSNNPSNAGPFPLRTDSGSYTSRSEIAIGSPVVFFGDPIKKDADFRQIVTSEVVEILSHAQAKEM